jgi:hypothetical protein
MDTNDQDTETPGRHRGASQCLAVVLVVIAATAALPAQDVPIEYRVKAAYLFNFAKFVEWPSSAGDGPLTICVAGRNVFGDVLADTVRGELIGNRAIVSRVILEPEPGCHIVFVPRGAATPAYLKAARTTPVLTVGEASDFIEQGGIATFLIQGGNVRFAIDASAAERAGLRISSRLLRLSRDPRGGL